jgi:hypothetical protein
VKLVLTIKEVVDALGGTPSYTTIWRRCEEGTIPARRVGNLWLIPGWWIEDLVERPLPERQI